MSAGTPPFLESVTLKRSGVRSFDEYPYCVPAVKHLERLTFHPAVTFFIGENGTGKSTLLEAIARVEGFNREGGSRNFHFADRRQWEPEELAWNLGVSRAPSRIKGRDGYFFRAESFYNLASEIDRLEMTDYYGGKSLHYQSHGESFLSLMLHRFIGGGLYLFDEPEAALSPQRQLSFLAALHQLIRNESQAIIATHSPIIMAYPYATIYEFTETGIHPIEYEETEHYKVTRMFFDRREQMLDELINMEE